MVAIPPDCYTLIFVIDCPQPGHLFNFSAEHVDGYMGFFPPGGELDAHTPEGYSNATLTVPKVMFLEAVQQSFPEIPDRILERGAGLVIGPLEQASAAIDSAGAGYRQEIGVGMGVLAYGPFLEELQPVVRGEPDGDAEAVLLNSDQAFRFSRMALFRVQGSPMHDVSPEELALAIRGACLEPCQLSRSPVPSRLARAIFPNVCLDFVQLGPAMLFTGQMPRDYYTLAFVMKCPEPGHAFNFSVQHLDGHMGFFSPDGSLDAHTPEGYSNAMLTVPREMFLAAVEQSIPNFPDRILKRGAGLLVGPEEQSRLRPLLASVLDGLANPTDTLAALSALDELEQMLLDAFLAGLRSGLDSKVPRPGIRVARRIRRLRKARDFIRESVQKPLRLDDLMSELGMSPRGVEVLFQDTIGIGPSAFIRHQRLHGVRRALLATAPQPGIIKKLALQWGFWHMGHFSKNYSLLFGENPTSTLKRG